MLNVTFLPMATEKLLHSKWFTAFYVIFRKASCFFAHYFDSHSRVSLWPSMDSMLCRGCFFYFLYNEDWIILYNILYFLFGLAFRGHQHPLQKSRTKTGTGLFLFLKSGEQVWARRLPTYTISHVSSVPEKEAGCRDAISCSQLMFTSNLRVALAFILLPLSHIFLSSWLCWLHTHPGISGSEYCPAIFTLGFWCLCLPKFLSQSVNRTGQILANLAGKVEWWPWCFLFLSALISLAVSGRGWGEHVGGLACCRSI